MKKLPASIDKESIRVDGRGKGTICEVQYQEKEVTKEDEGQERRKEIQRQVDDLEETADKVIGHFGERANESFVGVANGVFIFSCSPRDPG